MAVGDRILCHSIVEVRKNSTVEEVALISIGLLTMCEQKIKFACVEDLHQSCAGKFVDLMRAFARGGRNDD